MIWLSPFLDSSTWDSGFISNTVVNVLPRGEKGWGDWASGEMGSSLMSSPTLNDHVSDQW